MVQSSVAAQGDKGWARASSMRLLGLTAARSLGQVFTPRPIADWMAQWACQGRPRTLLDPALGGGVFIEAGASVLAGKRRLRNVRFDAFEIDHALIERFCPPSHVNVRVRAADFITTDFTTRYDAVLANPPYIRHHQLAYGEGVFTQFDRLCGRPISRMTNLYGLFLLKIWSLLSPRGRAAVITPAEWLNADFGAAIKTYLLAENAIEAIVAFDHGAAVFDGVLTTAAITLVRRDRKASDPVRLTTVQNAADLSQLVVEKIEGCRRDQLDARRKWTALLRGGSSPMARTGRLGDLAACTRGIATGANDFFTLRPSELRRWKIHTSDVTPCITRARQLRDGAFTHRHLTELVNLDERIYLLRPRPKLTKSVQAYLAHGRARSIHRRYLPAHRATWYRPEVRQPAPILVSVFTRGRFRFVLNDAGVLNLTAYHGIYPRDSSARSVHNLFKYLCSKQARDLLRDHCRIYAHGLFKVEPRDIESLPVPQRLVTKPESLIPHP